MPGAKRTTTDRTTGKRTTAKRATADRTTGRRSTAKRTAGTATRAATKATKRTTTRAAVSPDGASASAARGRTAKPGTRASTSKRGAAPGRAPRTRGRGAPRRLADLGITARTFEESTEIGREARKAHPRADLGSWDTPARRRDPVALLEEQDTTRLPWLVPVRHGRMSVSPFTFYRGTARIMAADLATTSSSGIVVQLGGDAHLANFGAYASPSRQLVFDQNDFDETLPGPWEWDVKRLAASFFLAARHLGFTRPMARDAAATAARSYRDSMRAFADAPHLVLWYDHTRVDDMSEQRLFGIDADLTARIERFARKARSRTSVQALRKLAEQVDGRYRLRSQPPLLVPLRDVEDAAAAATIESATVDAFDRYKQSLRDDRHVLLDRYTPVDLGIKVVGVGSVGTLCMVMLLQGRDAEDPLFLQVKEADASVLEEFVGESTYEEHGRRVVEGQRLIQAESDTFLGWTSFRRHFYVRQLRDWKASVDLETADPTRLSFYARVCGRVLARGHARSGDGVAIAAYLGKGDAFERAIAAFSDAYEKQVRADYTAFTAAIGDGRIRASSDAGEDLV